MPLQTVWIIHSFLACQLNFCLTWQAMCCRNDCDRLPKFRHSFLFVRIILSYCCHCGFVSLSLELDCKGFFTCSPVKWIAHSGFISMIFLSCLGGILSHIDTAALEIPNILASLDALPASMIAVCFMLNILNLNNLLGLGKTPSKTVKMLVKIQSS